MPLFEVHVPVLENSQPSSKLSRVLWQMGGKSKENLQLRLWNLNICIEKVDAKEMLIDQDDISDDIIALGTCFSMFVYIRADWQKSDSSVDREPEGNWRWNSNSRDILTSSPSFSHPTTRVPQSAGSQARKPLTNTPTF